MVELYQRRNQCESMRGDIKDIFKMAKSTHETQHPER